MKMHPFEKAGLGVAPFRCVGVSENWYETAGGAHRQPGGCCQYCGTGILYEYKILSSDGREFVVGSDCVAKTHSEVAGFEKVKKEHDKAKRQARAEAKRIEREKSWAEQRRIWQEQRMAETAAWREEHKDVVERLQAYEGRQDGHDFLMNMRMGLANYGRLTDNQLNAVIRTFKKIDENAQVASVSRFVGEIDSRIRNLEAKLVFCRVIGYKRIGYSEVPNVLVKFVTRDGDQLTWWTSRTYDTSDELQTISFRVKAHELYEGVKQTIVSHVKFADKV